MNIAGLNIDIGPMIPRAIGAAGAAAIGAYADVHMNPILPGKLSNSEVWKLVGITADVLNVPADRTYWGKAVDGWSDYGIGSLTETAVANHLVSTASTSPTTTTTTTTVARASTPGGGSTMPTTAGQGIPSSAGAQFEQATSGL